MEPSVLSIATFAASLSTLVAVAAMARCLKRLVMSPQELEKRLMDAFNRGRFQERHIWEEMLEREQAEFPAEIELPDEAEKGA